jgi:hypothetical protein
VGQDKEHLGQEKPEKGRCRAFSVASPNFGSGASQMQQKGRGILVPDSSPVWRANLELGFPRSHRLFPTSG